MDAQIKQLNTKAEKYAKHLEALESEIKKVIVGQDQVIEKLLLALVANGHILLEGVPGLAKTLMVNTLSTCLSGSFVRLQFTPDLLPADIIGTKVYNQKNTSFKTMKGPIFANFVLADEINRAPPKVQSALLEAMQERQVSIQGETHKLQEPFLVLATQNPVESEGTYKLPEAQVDRFMFKLLITYPSVEEEKEILHRFTEGISIKTKKILSPKLVQEMQQFNTKIYADDKIKHYAAEIVDATRNPQKYKIDATNLIEYGASPRASLWLILAGKAHAMKHGRGYVLPDDIAAVAYDVLRHRVLVTYEAEAEGITSDMIIEKILAAVTVP